MYSDVRYRQRRSSNFNRNLRYDKIHKTEICRYCEREQLSLTRLSSFILSPQRSVSCVSSYRYRYVSLKLDLDFPILVKILFFETRNIHSLVMSNWSTVPTATVMRFFLLNRRVKCTYPGLRKTSILCNNFRHKTSISRHDSLTWPKTNLQ